MKVEILPGKYVVAVSGGVDSMVLLDLLRQMPGVELVVAHFEHGVRQDSDEDRKMVQATAEKYGLTFVFDRGNLGAGVSEAAAREARYNFLRRVQKEQGARAIITAHHQDDLIETAIVNILRGTGRKGLSALGSGEHLVRPLLNVPKKDLLAYAKAHNLAWHEDSTNADDHYLRNYIRHQIMPRLGKDGRTQIVKHIEQAREANEELDALLAAQKPLSSPELDRRWFISLPYDIAASSTAA
jgi:tRNA(Ile)-lysidine synthase